MFELLVLGTINDGADGILTLPKDCQIFIELSTTLNEAFENNEFFFKYFGKKDITWDPSKIKIV